MIDKKEIRIGNWFSHDEVEWNAMGHSGYFQWQEGDWHYLVECRIDLSNIHPIPLTEEILLKCGFELVPPANPEFHLWSDYVKDGICITLPYFEMVFDNGDKAIEVKHLHQLQNIVHALTNTEIKINLHSK